MQFVNLFIELLIGRSALVIVLDDIRECLQMTIMHVRGRTGDIAQTRRLECAAVTQHLADDLPAGIEVRCDGTVTKVVEENTDVQPSADTDRDRPTDRPSRRFFLMYFEPSISLSLFRPIGKLFLNKNKYYYYYN